MRIDDDMELLRALSAICLIANSHLPSLPAAIEAQDQIRRIASDAMSKTLGKMVDQTKASADETIALLRRR